MTTLTRTGRSGMIAATIFTVLFLGNLHSAGAAVIGLNNVHWDHSSAVMGTGADFGDFRARLIELGHSIVVLDSFDAEDFVGLDAIFIQMPNPAATGPGFTPSEMNDIRSFASQRAVFVSDSTFWKNTAPLNDRGLDVFDDRQFLDNVVDYVSGGNAAVFVGDGGTGFDTDNMNELVAPYGISYSSADADGPGRVVTGFVDHPLTMGVLRVHTIFQKPLTVMSPSLDLTVLGGNDNILAVWEIPEPSTSVLAALGGLSLALLAWRRRRSSACE